MSKNERSAYAGVVMGAETGTPVASQRIWQEHVEKELRFQVVRSVFSHNPKTVLCLPDKPTRVRPDAKHLTAIHPNLSNTLELQDPRKKYNYPMTTSQEIGWDVELMNRHRDEMEIHTSPSSDVTEYASKYVSNHGYHPFSNKQFKYLARSSNPKK